MSTPHRSISCSNWQPGRRAAHGHAEVICGLDRDGDLAALALEALDALAQHARQSGLQVVEFLRHV
jgi:hypothetical protein